MKQLVQNNNTGEIELADIPMPIPKRGEVLVRTLASAVSAGTERGNLDFAKANILEKARRRPDLVKKVVNKARQEGVGTAYREAKARLDLPFPLGYSSAGIIIDHGPGAGAYAAGTLVACSGAHGATHGEYVTLPETMVAPAPEGVAPTEAAFATLGAVVLHGMRLGEITLGGSIAFIGLGLLGLLGVQMAKAGGMRVAALDLDESKVAMAADLGADLAICVADDSADRVRTWSGLTDGVDTVVITATSPTNDPLILAAEIARERGVLVLLGNFPPDLPRRYGYDKELILRFSRAWGPGTYDPAYQERGHDEGYPPSLVRWSAARNLGAYMDLVATGRVSVEPLLTHTFDIDHGVEAYGALGGGEGPKPLGIVITYPGAADEIEPREKRVAGVVPVAEGDAGRGGGGRDQAARVAHKARKVRIGVIGAGMYATTSLVPTLDAIEAAQLVGIASASGLRSWFGARKFGFEYSASHFETLLEDESLDAVVIATRHDLHAELAAQALAAGKHVWVEKPLGLSVNEVESAWAAQRDSRKALLVGFNRRYSPLSVRARELLSRSEAPIQIDMRVNPGALEAGHWVLDPAEGGGRLLSEGCHFFDLACFLADDVPTRVDARLIGPEEPWRQGFRATVEFAGGSTATILYAGSGPRGFWRERVDAFGDGVAVAIDNFKDISWSTGIRLRKKRGFSLQKGQSEMARAFISAAGENGPLVGQESLLTASMLSVAAQQSLAASAPVEVTPQGQPV